MEKTYVAILRGVNVSGKTMIKMVDLVKSMEKAGYEKVKTYIQSGNIVFKSDGNDTEKIRRHISEVIQKDFGATVPTPIVSGEYLKKVIQMNPFLSRADIDISKLHVTFLESKPLPEKVEAIDAEKYLPDEFTVVNEGIYLYCPNGYGTTKLSNNFFESKLKLTATTRNWATVNRLAKMAEELEAES